MKSKITKIKLTLALLFALAMPASVLAADIYVCGTGTVTLKYSGTYSLVSGDKVIWQKVDAAGDPSGAAVEKIYTSAATDTDLLLTGGAGDLAVAGEVFYKSHVISSSSAACSGDVSTAVSVYMLPAITVDLGSTSADYCSGATPTTVTATTNAASLPAGFAVTLSWTGSTGGAVNGTDNTKYDMTSTTAGTHTVAVSATYENTSGKALKTSAGGCATTATKSITIAPKPAAPTITVS
jgi:hypothetical protein